MKDIDLTHLLDVAICAADAAGRHALANKDRRTEATETFDHDIKLVLDVECQKIAEKVIAEEFPDHGILGEEDASPNAGSPYEWVIDPIDGTMNFSQGLEYWCSSVAVRYNQKVVAGCVFAPEYSKYYTAHIEDVAKLNGEEIKVSSTSRLSRAFIFTGISSKIENAEEPNLDLLRMLAVNTMKLRINGAAALDICHVADGTCDGFFQSGIYLWDYAAAGLVAEQAGAALSIYPRRENPLSATLLCSVPDIIEGLRAIYTKCV